MFHIIISNKHILLFLQNIIVVSHYSVTAQLNTMSDKIFFKNNTLRCIAVTIVFLFLQS